MGSSLPAISDLVLIPSILSVLGPFGLTQGWNG